MVSFSLAVSLHDLTEKARYICLLDLPTHSCAFNAHLNFLQQQFDFSFPCVSYWIFIGTLTLHSLRDLSILFLCFSSVRFLFHLWLLVLITSIVFSCCNYLIFYLFFFFHQEPFIFFTLVSNFFLVAFFCTFFIAKALNTELFLFLDYNWYVVYIYIDYYYFKVCVLILFVCLFFYILLYWRYLTDNNLSSLTLRMTNIKW